MNQFNRIYRVLWSKTKEQWVVTSELEGAGGKKQGKGVVSIFCAALVAAGMLSAAPQEADALTGTGALVSICTGTSATIPAGLYSSGQCTATLTDSLTNNGTINAGGVTTPAIALDSASTGVSITNNGGIDVYASLSNWTSTVSVAAIGGTANLGGNALAGTLNNTSSGSISATLNIAGPLVTGGSASSSIYVRGLDASANGITGALNNSGSITATLNKSLSYATRRNVPRTMAAEAVHVGVLSGSLTNDGSIVASSVNSGNHASSADINLSARGINGRTSINNGSLTNNGNISANVSNTGNVALSGLVRLHATGAQYGQSTTGILINSNTGNITATADNTGAGNTSGANLITALGLKVGGRFTWDFGGSIQNSGSISATATATAPTTAGFVGNNVNAIALQVNNLSGVVDNYGTISATATANNNTGTSNRISAYGVAFGSSGSGKSSATNGVLNNYGTISATGTGVAGVTQVYALASFGVWNVGGLTINNQLGGVVKGHVSLTEFAAPKANINNAGLIDLPFVSGVSSSITGNYVQQTGGVLRIEAETLSVQTGPSTSSTAAGYAWMSMGGTANFANSGTIDVNVSPNSTLVPGDTLTGVVHANAGITIPGAGLTVTDNSGTIDFVPVLAAGWAGPGSQKINLQVVAQGAADTQIPVITLTGSSVVNAGLGSTYTDAGATAVDNVDGVITPTAVSNVNITAVGSYTVVYNVSDAAGNAAVPVVRHVNVIVDTSPPVITLNGNASVSVVQNTTYTDAGATALDNVDGDVSANIITGGTFVNTSTAGNYTITYDVSDAAGNAATQLTRNITVTAAATSGGGTTTGGVTTDPYAGSSAIPCVAPSAGMIPTLLSLLAGVALIRRRKK